MERQKLVELLDAIEPSRLDYQNWVNVGMAIKHEGGSAFDWDQWSKRDNARYHAGECYRKWDSFQGTGTPVTGGTLVTLAKEHGWTSQRDPGHELEWDDVIREKEEHVVVDKNWLEAREVVEPTSWRPEQDLIRYLEILFEASENVGYVTASWEKDGRHMPTQGHWDRTAGELIEQLHKCQGDIGAVFGDYNPDVGAWIRFNPLDGKGCKNENVTDFRYALVESDSMDIDQQNAIIRALELPVVALVHSGKKSLHAITRIDAANYDEYRKRVNYLYEVCGKNGLKIDVQNRNPSRLSRMPGAMRLGHKQFLVEANIGKASWGEWQEWIEGVNDELPDPEALTSVWDNMPPLADPLINGVLRQGHKMLLAGPSKAGKSYALIELAVAIAEGRRWLRWQCAQGRVLYVNLELDRASCLHRFKDVYEALGWDPQNVGSIDVWNLRGRSVPMDKLAPKLIRRAQKKGYIAVIIDPIYKVITGDENSADQMAHFCNQFDRVCTDLGAAVIYCHHHSKGYQGNKRSMDRASGSGVFARDPDVLLDLTELDLTPAVVKQEENGVVAAECIRMLEKHQPGILEDRVSQDDICSSSRMTMHCKTWLSDTQLKALDRNIEEAKIRVETQTAWRIEGTLREFPKFPPVDLWFRYPIHALDESGVLKDLDPEDEKPAWQKAMEKRKDPDQRKADRQNSVEIAFSTLEMDNEEITTQDLADEMSTSIKTVARRLKEHGGFDIARQGGGNPGIVTRKQDGQQHE